MASFHKVASSPSVPILSADTMKNPCSIFGVTHPPVSEIHLQQHYLRSALSIYKNIRMTTDNTHVYVSAIEVCTFFFACRFNRLLGPTYEEVSASQTTKIIQNFHHSPVAYDEIERKRGDLLLQDTLPIFVKEWSDDAQKNPGQRSNNLLSFNLRSVRVGMRYKKTRQLRNERASKRRCHFLGRRGVLRNEGR
jgi:hypothetical protein